MKTDINKQIEEYTIDDFERLAMETDYAIEANEDTFKINEADAGAFFAEGLKHGVKLIQHSSRWRKVSEGLPPIDDAGVSINVLINVRLKSNNQDLTCVIEGFYDFDIEEWFLLIPLPKKYKIEILSWKPID